MNKPATELRYTLSPEEYYVYGSQRLGSIRHYTAQSEALSTNRAGRRRYESADHLGNVRAVMSDRLAVNDAAHRADQWAAYDYYPFGMPVAHRSVNMAEFKASKFTTIDSVEIVTFDDPEPIVEPTGTGDFAQLINAQNDLWYGRAYVTATGSFTEHSAVSTAAPIYQNNASHTEVQMAGMGYQKYEIIHRLRIADHSQMAVGDKIAVSFIFSVAGGQAGGYGRIEVRNTATEAVYFARNMSAASSNQDWLESFTFELQAAEVDIVLIGTFNNTTTFTSTSTDTWYTNNLVTSGWHIDWINRNVDVVQNSSDTEFWTKERYRYGFNGQEKENELWGDGLGYDFTERIYSTLVGRFVSVDPLTHQFSWYSPYQFAGNKPIWAIDLDGREEFFRTTYFVDGELWKTELSVVSDKDLHRGIQRVHNSRVDIHKDDILVRYIGSQKGVNALANGEKADIYKMTQDDDGTYWRYDVGSKPLGFQRYEVSPNSNNDDKNESKDPVAASVSRWDNLGLTKRFAENKSVDPGLDLPQGLNAVPESPENRNTANGENVGGANGFSVMIKPRGREETYDVNYRGNVITIQGSNDSD